VSLNRGDSQGKTPISKQTEQEGKVKKGHPHSSGDGICLWENYDNTGEAKIQKKVRDIRKKRRSVFYRGTKDKKRECQKRGVWAIAEKRKETTLRQTPRMGEKTYTVTKT